MKTCKICKVEKEFEQFHVRRETHRHSYCKLCHIEYTINQRANKDIMPYNKIGLILALHAQPQVFLVRELGFKKKRISDYVNNKSQPPAPVMFQIAKALNVKPSELINDELLNQLL